MKEQKEVKFDSSNRPHIKQLFITYSALNVFNVIKFPNDVCTGSNGLNGTCYTSEECAAKGGSSSGACASGFGVCCTFSLSCGASATENNTYFVQDTFTTWSGSSSPCSYKICPLAGVCRIRLDLTAFDITGPIAKTDVSDSDQGVGKCKLESMTVTAPGMKSPPEICGINTGQHMFLDVTDECVDINIHVNTLDTTNTRSWSIHAKQFTCGDTMAGPTGCLQYHTGLQGDVATFNWDLSGTTSAIFATTTHLANQDYDICFRREENYCRTCFSPKFAKSFGISIAGTAVNSASGVACDGSTVGKTDFIEIPGAQVAAMSTTTSEFTTKAATIGWDRMCGVIFNALDTQTAETTVCSEYYLYAGH